MTALCDARTKCSGMRVRDWVAGGQYDINSQLQTNKEAILLRSIMLNMFLVRE